MQMYTKHSLRLCTSTARICSTMMVGRLRSSFVFLGFMVFSWVRVAFSMNFPGLGTLRFCWCYFVAGRQSQAGAARVIFIFKIPPQACIFIRHIFPFRCNFFALFLFPNAQLHFYSRAIFYGIFLACCFNNYYEGTLSTHTHTLCRTHKFKYLSLFSKLTFSSDAWWQTGKWKTLNVIKYNHLTSRRNASALHIFALRALSVKFICNL